MHIYRSYNSIHPTDSSDANACLHTNSIKRSFKLNCTLFLLLGTASLCGCMKNNDTTLPAVTPQITYVSGPIPMFIPTRTPQETDKASDKPLESPSVSEVNESSDSKADNPAFQSTDSKRHPVDLNTDCDSLTFLVNRDHTLSNSFIPYDLISPDIPFCFDEKDTDKRMLKSVAAHALEKMYRAGLEDGVKFVGVSAYRSYDRQYDIYATNYLTKGPSHTNLYSAPPGASEHQTGLAIDLSCKEIGYDLIDSFATTKEGLWLEKNSWKFGFTLRYPKDKVDITGYAYEPWHVRYVGIELATYLHENNICLEEYYASPIDIPADSLSDVCLIDITEPHFEEIYISIRQECYIRDKNGAVLFSADNIPYTIPAIRDSNGKVLTYKDFATGLNKTAFYEPVFNIDGSLATGRNGHPIFKKLLYKDSDNIYRCSDGAPAFLEPVYDRYGKIYSENDVYYFCEPLRNINGTIYEKDGHIFSLCPKRSANCDLVFDAYGNIEFFEPIYDYNTSSLTYGNPIFDGNDELICKDSGIYLFVKNQWTKNCANIRTK